MDPLAVKKNQSQYVNISIATIINDTIIHVYVK